MTQTENLQKNTSPEGLLDPSAMRLAETLARIRDHAEEIADTANELLQALTPLEVRADDLPWKRYSGGNGEWILWERIPEAKPIVDALKAAGGKMTLGGYHYRIQGDRQQFIARYPCSGGHGL